ncbi:MAG: glycosyltransferase family 9 protein [Roseimicrobium sp.]
MPRILLIQLKRIGDFILTAPAAQALHEAMPQAELVMLVPSGVADLARCLAPVHRVIPYAAGRVNLETWASTIAGEWDACLDFTGTDRSALIAQLSRAKKRIGYTKFARGLRKLVLTDTCDASVRDLHTVDFHLALVSKLLGREVTTSAKPPFRIPAGTVTSARAKLHEAGGSEPYAILHIGTAREEKFWEDERWAQVAQHLHDHHGLKIVLTGSGDGLEKAHLDHLRSLLRVPFADLTGKLPLPELAAVIRDCRVIAGVDSMAMHLASLFTKPQVALFGPTNPFQWRARHEKARIIAPYSEQPVQEFLPRMKKGSMTDIPTSRVTAALDALIG